RSHGSKKSGSGHPLGWLPLLPSGPGGVHRLYVTQSHRLFSAWRVGRTTTFCGQRREEPVPQREIRDPPEGRPTGVGPRPQEHGARADLERDIEAIERQRQTLAPRLEIGLLADPTAQKGIPPGRGRKRPEGGPLALGEAQSDHLIGILYGPA